MFLTRVILCCLTGNIVSSEYTFRFVQNSSNEGLVELYINNTWGLVTGSFEVFDDYTSRVLCETLGYGDTGFSTVSISDSNVSYTGYIWNNMVRCSGWETLGTECIFGSWEAQIQTRSSNLTLLHCFEYHIMDIRLKGGVLQNEGRLEVNVGGRWGTVCFSGTVFDSTNINNICKFLGYLWKSSWPPSMATDDLGEAREIWISDLNCSSHSTINDCSLTKGVTTGCSSHTYDLHLRCETVYLFGGITRNSGGIWTTIRGETQAVCEAGIDMSAANVFCNILGYSGAKSISSIKDDSSSFAFKGRLVCNGTETALEYCNIIDDTSINCNESGVAYITCKGGPVKIIPIDDKPYEGVFVHYYMNAWRHIQSSFISETSARTLCRFLGYGYKSYAASSENDVAGGSDMLRNILCNGNESETAECILYIYETCYDSPCEEPSKETIVLFCSECHPGFYGDQCLACECNSTNTKSCDTVSGKCFCESGWTGETCSNDVDECSTESNSCTINRKCVNSAGSYSCECDLGYVEIGEDCQVLSGTDETDTKNLVIILSCGIGGLLLIILVVIICVCQYRRIKKGTMDENRKPVTSNRFGRTKVLATSIRSTGKEEMYDTIQHVPDTIDGDALRVKDNKRDNVQGKDIVSRKEHEQERGSYLTREQIYGNLDLNLVKPNVKEVYDCTYPKGGKTDIGQVGRKLPEVPENSSKYGNERKGHYSQLNVQGLQDQTYEPMSDDEGYLKPVGIGYPKQVGSSGFKKPV